MAEPDYGLPHMGMHINFAYRGGSIHWMGSPGERIRQLRKAKHLNQTQLAGLVGVDQSTISDMEKGVTKEFSAVNLIRLADALETPAEYIMKGESASWPLRKVDLSSYLALKVEDRAYVEGRMQEAIEACLSTTEGKLTPRTANSSVPTTTAEPGKKPARGLYDQVTVVGGKREAGKSGGIQKPRSGRGPKRAA